MLPKLIFIIGAACSGKSSFIRAIDADDYICLDDVKPLYKIFKADELLRKNPKEFREFVVKNHLESFYAEDKANSIAIDSGGYRIINPAVWDYILQITASEIVRGLKYIIEFSRGLDEAYINTNVFATGEVCNLCGQNKSFPYLVKCDNNYLCIKNISDADLAMALEKQLDKKQQNLETDIVIPNLSPSVGIEDYIKRFGEIPD